MLDFESRRIRDLRGIDFSKLEFEDLRWKYGTFQSVSTGSGCDKKYSSWSGVRLVPGGGEADPRKGRTGAAGIFDPVVFRAELSQGIRR